MVLYPIDKSGTFTEAQSPPLEFEFPYKKGNAPNVERQDKPHAHHVLEDSKGLIYVCDLGSDRVWVIEKKGEDKLAVKGYLQAPEGSGPRHAILSPDGTSISTSRLRLIIILHSPCVNPYNSTGHEADPIRPEKHLYVLTELHHNLFIYDLTKPLPSHPLPDVERNIVPPSVPKESQPEMSSAELCLNPSIKNVLYASNRGQLQLKNSGDGDVTGDSVAIILLSEDGGKVQSIKHVETGGDGLRGMQISKDGKYAAVAGQNGGGVEIYKIGGERGDDWKLAAKDETLESVVSFVWL